MTSSIRSASGVTARPIRFTGDIPGWQEILTTLGGVLISEHPGWLVYQLGSGRLALHQANDDYPPSHTDLGLETPVPLDEAVGGAAEQGLAITLEDTDHGQAGLVRAQDGTTFTLDRPTPAEDTEPPTEARLTVMQIWYTKRTREALDVFDALGLKRRVIGHDGTWTDLICPGGGLAAVHLADEEVGAELAFEFSGDVEGLIQPLAAIGAEPVLIDESYGRTLRFTDPDGGKAIWINEKMTDLYGYTLAEM